MTREHPDSLTRSADSTWEPRQRLSQQGGHGPPPAHPAGAVTTGGTALRGHGDVSTETHPLRSLLCSPKWNFRVWPSGTSPPASLATVPQLFSPTPASCG